MESIFYLLVLVFGLSVGSFMNSWVWRTRENLSINQYRSICPNCRMQIVWYDNIPVFSFIYLKGQCRKCKSKIHYQYPLVEIWCGIIFLFIALFYNDSSVFPSINIEIVRDWIILTLLTFIFLYDLRYREILNFPTLIAGSMLFGAMFGAGFFLFLYFISKGAWIGGGDVRLGFFMGIILGWPNILIAFFVAYLTGAVFSLFLILIKKKTIKSETA